MLACLVVLGTAVRLVIGLRLQLWQAAPDHLAWALLLEEARLDGLHLDLLVHAPHDTGTGLLGLLALALRPLVASPVLALVASALAWDTVVRAVQITVTWRVFGKPAALAFGAWTVLAVPMLLPWATVNVALHHAASLWPFLLLAALVRSRWGLATAVTCAALAFSYHGVVLVPVLLWALRKARPRQLLGALLALGLTGLALWSFRAQADLGFVLEQLPTWSVRGAEAGQGALADKLPLLWQTWTRVLPAGLFTEPLGTASILAGRLWLLVAAVGVGLGLKGDRRAVGLGLALVLTFGLVYALSPFSDLPRGAWDYFATRHLAWVLPLLACLAFSGWSTLPRAGIAVTAAAVAATGWSLATAPLLPVAPTSLEPVGFVIGRKLGHQPERLDRLAARLDDPTVLLGGIGWGTTAGVERFGRDPRGDAPQLLHLLVDRYRPGARAAVSAGVVGAFAPDRNPRLDPDQLTAWSQAGWLQRVQLDGPLVKREPAHAAFYGNGSLSLEALETGALALELSGTPAAGRGPRVSLQGEAWREERELGTAVEVWTTPPLQAGETLTLRFADDLVDDQGGDRGVMLWWVGPATAR